MTEEIKTSDHEVTIDGVVYIPRKEPLHKKFDPHVPDPNEHTAKCNEDCGLHRVNEIKNNGMCNRDLDCCTKGF